MHLEVSWTKAKIQDYGALIGVLVWLICACSEGTEVTESLTYLVSVVHNSGLSHQEVR